MSAQHTPGPWEVREDDGEYNVHAADSYSCGFRVQMRIAEDVGGYRKQLEDGSWSDAEVIANARLIAAAPDGLAAARKALDECCDLIGTPAGEALAAFIAKATGEQDENERYAAAVQR